MKKKNIITRDKLSRTQKGQIVSENNEYFIIMDKILHTFPDKKPIENVNKGYKIYDYFIMHYVNEKTTNITCWFNFVEKEYGIILKVPDEISNESLKISIEYDKNLKIPYFLVESSENFYKIYDFQETEYEIYEDKNYYDKNKKFIYAWGTQYMVKTGYTLKKFFESILNKKKMTIKNNWE